MRKKFIILIALLVSSILANSMVCYCSNKDLEEYFDIEKYNYMCNELLNVGVIDNINDSRTYVSREECIKSILRIIGVNDEMAQKYTYLNDENGGNEVLTLFNVFCGYLIIIGLIVLTMNYLIYKIDFNLYTENKR